ncbi:hypothetical protein [Micromonospora haikouensis]|uniref:hypothetical protein n=1 Tax=Micromonospora haikouensis TaxID=686309 RepID=UPI003D71A8B6
MTQRTVRELLDLLAAGEMTVEQVAADFRTRPWPKAPSVSDVEAWGVTDLPAPGSDSWATVSADSRLSPDHYQTLGRAYQQALAR